jgi:hypothetical protein
MALLAHSEQIDRAVNSAVQSVSAFSQEVNGSLTLGTGDGLHSSSSAAAAASSSAAHC